MAMRECRKARVGELGVWFCFDTLHVVAELEDEGGPWKEGSAG